MNPWNRRTFLATGATLATGFGLSACLSDKESNAIEGGFTGIQPERGHMLRDAHTWPAPSAHFKTNVLIAGGGVAGLAAARALRLQGMDDFALLELEDSAGGNARGTSVGGIACPMGAHYLPLPGDDAPEVQNLLEELGLRRRVAGRWMYDERHLCHSPQERLYFDGHWQDGLLPVHDVGADTLAQYRQFAALVDQTRKQEVWSLPAYSAPATPTKKALAAQRFDGYLAQQGLHDAHLLWYLDYCCRDDYGAGIAAVSAWAGLHYFASRHGFSAPGMEHTEREGLLTWPQGNGWLTQRMAAPLGERLRTSRIVVRIAVDKHGAEVDAFNIANQTMERWHAQNVVVALPVFVAARVVQNPPTWLQDAARRAVYAPWLVANIQIDKALTDRPGAAPSWDNVIYGDSGRAPGLGYVDAMHQSLQSVPSATVLTYYLAPGIAARRQLLQTSWAQWRDTILAELSIPHPDLPGKVRRIDIARYGHAMVVPVTSGQGHIGFRPAGSSDTSPRADRLRFAHSDWAGYSVFEEAFAIGHASGTATAQQIHAYNAGRREDRPFWSVADGLKRTAMFANPVQL
jgi:monoamine oxidase